MQLQHWDIEFGKLYGELGGIGAYVARNDHRLRSAVRQDQNELMRLRLTILQARNRIKKLKSRPVVESARFKSLRHWLFVTVDKLTEFFEGRLNLITKVMWLKLLEARLKGRVDVEDFFFEEEELVDMALRKVELENLVRQYAEELDKVKKYRTDLYDRYARLQAACANHDSMGSLQTRLGRGVEDGLSSPALKGLETYFKQLIAPIQYNLGQKRLMQDRLSASYGDFIRSARSLVCNTLKEPRDRARLKPAEINTAIAELAQVQHRLRAESAKLQRIDSPAAHPILMKNSGKKAKKDPSLRSG